MTHECNCGSHLSNPGHQPIFTFEEIWRIRLIQLGIPPNLADRMFMDVASLGIDTLSITSISQLVPIMKQNGFQTLGWWEDLQLILQQLIASVPAIILMAVGGGLLFFLRNVKVKKIPIGLIGLVPISIGIMNLIQVFLPPEEGNFSPQEGG